MRMFENLTVEDGGRITLSDGVRDRYGLEADTPLRIIETLNGILLVPLTNEPMSASLMAELEEWQSLSAESLAVFHYDNADKEA